MTSHRHISELPDWDGSPHVSIELGRNLISRYEKDTTKMHQMIEACMIFQWFQVWINGDFIDDKRPGDNWRYTSLFKKKNAMEISLPLFGPWPRLEHNTAREECQRSLEEGPVTSSGSFAPPEALALQSLHSTNGQPCSERSVGSEREGETW